MNITHRTRRMRKTPISRGMVRETRVSKDSLIYPIFFEEGDNIKAHIDAMPGQYRYSPDRAQEPIDECLDLDIVAFYEEFGLNEAHTNAIVVKEGE